MGNSASKAGKGGMHSDTEDVTHGGRVGSQNFGNHQRSQLARVSDGPESFEGSSDIGGGLLPRKRTVKKGQSQPPKFRGE